MLEHFILYILILSGWEADGNTGSCGRGDHAGGGAYFYMEIIKAISEGFDVVGADGEDYSLIEEVYVDKLMLGVEISCGNKCSSVGNHIILDEGRERYPVDQYHTNSIEVRGWTSKSNHVAGPVLVQ